MNGEILLIEDEKKIARVLMLELTHEGYRVRLAENGKEGLELALSESWDLILLNIMLPEISGMEVLRKVRQANITTPVIILTARDTVPDKVSGLDQGANDYVTKPFAIEELLARIRNLLRMAGGSTDSEDRVIHAADLRIDMNTRTVVRDEQQIELTPKEFDLLQYLARNQGRVLTREQIISEVWGYDFVGDTNVVDVYIRYLRKKIDEPFEPKLIQTIRGIGYMLKEPES